MMNIAQVTETAEKQWKTTTHAVMKNDEKIAHYDQENMKMKNQGN